MMLRFHLCGQVSIRRKYGVFLLVFLAVLVSTIAFCLVCSNVMWFSRQRQFLLPSTVPWLKDSRNYYNLSLLKDFRDDDSLLVDIKNFKYVINNDRCNSSNSVFILIFVHTAPDNFDRRTVIRETWGAENNIAPDVVRVVFMMGKTANKSLESAIISENRKHHDIIQGNFVDSYRNLTYKYIMGLKWVTYHCRQARYILKTDDDVYLNIFLLKYYLKGTYGTTYIPRSLISCFVMPNSYVKRSHRSKWFVSVHEYNGRYYPIYCAGWGIIMSPDVVFNLYVESHKHPYFWVDDVFVSGVLADKIEASHVDFAEKFPLIEASMLEWLKMETPNQNMVLGYYDIDVDTIRLLWSKTQMYYRISQKNSG